MSKRWILPVVVILVWLVAGGAAGPLAGKLSTVQENDNANFLPASAESTKALDVLRSFSDASSVPATVVVERDGGLTAADRRAVDGWRAEIADIPLVADDGVGRLIPSADGEAGQLVVTIATEDGEKLISAVDAIRAVLDDAPTGLTALVGGQGGVLADFVDAFSAIDGLLLVVALGVVLLILLVVYRTPVLPVLVLLSALLGLAIASAAVYGMAKGDLLDLNGQSQGILFILAIGAATDYSLLIVARFREELKDHSSRFTAMREALRKAWEPIVASGITVILGLLCLLLADQTSLAGLGPVGAVGIAGAMLSSLTLLPAALVLLGRAAFWPFRPAYGSEHRDERGVWGAVARLVARRAPAVAIVTGLVLAGAAGFITTLNEEQVPQTDLFLTAEESVTAQDVLDAHFDSDNANPMQVVVPAADTGDVVSRLTGAEGVAPSRPGAPPTVFPIPDPGAPQSAQPRVVDGQAVVLATLADPADSAAAIDTVERLREQLHAIDDRILVGGNTAIQIDNRDTTARDRAVVIPAILVVIVIVLALLLRSVLAAGLLLLANLLSFGATLGIAAVVFNHVFDFPAADPSVSLIGFVFLVALGIDYSIFLMTRVREEALQRGTREGVLKGLRVTGGVITSAGVVLAATFAALGVVPILFLAEIAFIVAFGVLLDTLVVRSLLVPSLCYVLGPRTWWPSRLWREGR